jgi:hypothetical protein
MMDDDQWQLAWEEVKTRLMRKADMATKPQREALFRLSRQLSEAFPTEDRKMRERLGP